jgi:hypothetical protein
MGGVCLDVLDLPGPVRLRLTDVGGRFVADHEVHLDAVTGATRSEIALRDRMTCEAP